MPGSPRFDLTAVRSYYDRHTPSFVTYGQGGGEGAIHRAVWGPGTTTRDEAFHFVEDRIADVAPGLSPAPLRTRPAHVVDLGCGVGGSLCYLAGQLPIQGTGLTLSPIQARHATTRIHKAGLTGRVRCLEGDFCDPPADIPPADVVFAIESFVHGPDPALFFAASHRLLCPGGILIICDDFARATTDPGASVALRRYRQGWHINTLLLPEQLQEVAGDHGFTHEHTTDLTPHLELDRPRDRLIALLVALVGWIPAVASRHDDLVGGSALQTCLKRGWVGYDLAVFRRNPD